MEAVKNDHKDCSLIGDMKCNVPLEGIANSIDYIPVFIQHMT